ncbi:hypothetical protein LIER_01449 [Lithospermum erythrorhizon]|uniref:Retrovirus-related Pol polyprotein from transposon TNT 1-94-like beta-barrel domain-containing protein n=1 Tax=Lithospermum erythrorhizon TaxID=34254 RepID=A0AAV3NMF0_LITER
MHKFNGWPCNNGLPQLVSKEFYVDNSNINTTGAPQNSLVPFNSQWHFDTEATSHMTPHFVILFSLRPYTNHERVLVSDGSLVSIIHFETLSFPISSTKSFVLQDVLVVPNLLSVKHFSLDNNCIYIHLE